ncbi:MAG: flavodoxin domain-containing protein [Actinomycetota bacterium]
MKVLVTAASKHGATRDIAQAIAEVLAERGFDASLLEPQEVGPVEGYDAVVLGSSVYAGRWAKPAKELVERSGDALAARPVWLFSSGPIGDPLKPEGDPADAAEVMKATGAREHRVFGGKIDKRELNLAERAVVRAVRAADGDFRDWDEIRAWAGGIADALAVAS